jgi:hypothetical protein
MQLIKLNQLLIDHIFLLKTLELQIAILFNSLEKLNNTVTSYKI